MDTEATTHTKRIDTSLDDLIKGDKNYGLIPRVNDELAPKDDGGMSQSPPSSGYESPEPWNAFSDEED